MARIANDSPSSQRGQEEKYPYALWFDGNKWELCGTTEDGQGTPLTTPDFICGLSSMCAALKKAAKRRSIKIKTQINVKLRLVYVQSMGPIIPKVSTKVPSPSISKAGIVL